MENYDLYNFSSFRDSTYTEGDGISDGIDPTNGNIEQIFDGINRFEIVFVR